MEDVRKSALITGAGGFVGGHLAHRLLHEGWQVHAIVRDGSRIGDDLRHAGLITHVHDGSTQCMVNIAHDAEPTIAFHLASLFIAEHHPEQVEPLISSNVLFGAQLLEGLRAANVPFLVNTGTSWQHYGDAEYNPVCLYAATKQAFEDIVRYYTEATPLRVVTLKLFDTYGPNDHRQKLFALLRRAADSGEQLLMSPGEQLIDLVYIDDVVDAFLAAAAKLIAGLGARQETYAVSSGKPIKLHDLVDLYASVTARRLHITWAGRAYRTREVMSPWRGDEGLPNWQPMVMLENGIKLATEEYG
ncbi:NAD-dependent epimerase/dehydratase [Acidithiobacillus ferrivorans SS3]|uniref:NAD-dependent epimerase/dehydratase n=1 Tax=Acidithiobacillus ferrivorans SS3 TaxID=743299 RepID=G0JPA1_9PROT|nr:NAD-dependent epimerase/dehydratase family protein [Acidithiobacillus ferrivorans]AEM47332.1 NAD-dependent epimerase/dehydratase [Acidithiobacillus ferrivorans SS3]